MKTVHSLVIAATLTAGLLLPAVSQAHVSVSIGFGLPVVPVVAAPVYVEQPVMIEPAPVVVERAPIVVEPAPVVYGAPRYVPVPLPYYHHREEWRDGPHGGPREVRYDGPHGGPHGWR